MSSGEATGSGVRGRGESSSSGEVEISSVLLVDDDDDVRTISELCLTNVGGLEVTAVSSGQAALDVVEELAPDLILLDVMMPGLDGLDTLRLLRKRGVKTPVIFLTARAQAHEVRGYGEAGATGIIGKPFDPMKLSEEIRQILADARRDSDQR